MVASIRASMTTTSSVSFPLHPHFATDATSTIVVGPWSLDAMLEAAAAARGRTAGYNNYFVNESSELVGSVRLAATDALRKWSRPKSRR